jgi:hypothetical protein
MKESGKVSCRRRGQGKAWKEIPAALKDELSQ